MRVRDLKGVLAALPDDMEILETRMSDYELMKRKHWEIIQAVPYEGGWVMRSHPTMSEENKSKEKTYLHFSGI